MSEKTVSTSKEKDLSEVSKNVKLFFKNNYLKKTELKKIEKSDDNFLLDYPNDLLSENIKLSPMINPIPYFDISSQNTFNSNLNKKINTNTSFSNKEDKTKILNKNLKRVININNNRYFRKFSPNQINSYYSNNTEVINNNKINYEIYLNNKIKLVNNFAKKNLNNSKNIITGIKKKKIFCNRLYFSTDNFYESDMFHRKNEEQEEQKKRKIKLLGQKINVATMKIEILQNYKKNINISKIKKKIEYNKIYCNNDLKRLKENYNSNIHNHMNKIKYLKIKLLKCQENYININTHKEKIKKEELMFKIQKMEIIEKILFLKKKINELFYPDKSDNFNLEDSLEDKTINDISFNDFSNLKDTLTIGGNYIENNKKNINNMNENKIIKMNKLQINFFKANFIKNRKGNNK